MGQIFLQKGHMNTTFLGQFEQKLKIKAYHRSTKTEDRNLTTASAIGFIYNSIPYLGLHDLSI